jgi:hypothetical protein
MHGSSAINRKSFEAAEAHYEAVIKHCDVDFIKLPDTLFNLAILLVFTLEDSDDHIAVLARARRHFQNGLEASKRLSRWCPQRSHADSQKLAKLLITRLANTSPQVLAAVSEAEKKAKKNR